MTKKETNSHRMQKRDKESVWVTCHKGRLEFLDGSVRQALHLISFEAPYASGNPGWLSILPQDSSSPDGFRRLAEFELLQPGANLEFQVSRGILPYAYSPLERNKTFTDDCDSRHGSTVFEVSLKAVHVHLRPKSLAIQG
jgi:hypothetical protein